MNSGSTEHTISSRRRQSLELAAVLTIVVVGIALRLQHLDTKPFWVDEAESAINALTILERGYPSDTYLGIPIYENTNVWFWPEHPEYEFRDISYSERHVAVYHGWLPLYSIAASFALHGIPPDLPDGNLRSRHTIDEQKRRTRAARLPAVVFAVLFLLAAFAGGTLIFGREAGWAALCMATIYPYHLQVSDQARYYSAQVALTTVCCVGLWLMVRQLEWKHVVIASVSYVLLFHTHLLSFFTAALMAGLCLPVIVHRHRDWLVKIGVFSIIGAAGILPWIFWTGFLVHQNRIPRAWSLLDLPSDLLKYRPFTWWSVAPGVMIVLIVFARHFRPGSLPAGHPFITARVSMAVLFLGSWALVGYVAFLTCIPAASLSAERLNLSYWGPLFLLGAILAAALVRMLVPSLSPSVSSALTFALLVLIFVGTGHSLSFKHYPGSGNWVGQQAIFSTIDSFHLDRSARIFSVPNNHLVMTFYSGLPVQDITSVRKAFLDSYPGEIVYLDYPATLPDAADPDQVLSAAKQAGQHLSNVQVQELSARIRTFRYRQLINQAVTPGVSSQVDDLPDYAVPLLAAHDEQLDVDFDKVSQEIMLRGFPIRGWFEWAAAFKYRFVDPNSRRGVHANYAHRLRGSTCLFLPGPVAIYRAPWHPPESSQPIHFDFTHAPGPASLQN